jgi:hypothetical protein
MRAMLHGQGRETGYAGLAPELLRVLLKVIVCADLPIEAGRERWLKTSRS